MQNQVCDKLNSKSYKHTLGAHLIMCCKYRKKLLTWELDTDIKNIVYDISQKDDTKFLIDTMETDKDHIHIMIEYLPDISISQIVRRLKQLTTDYIWKHYEQELKKEFRVEKTFWSDWYFVCSIWDASPETIRKYIENQG